MAGYYIGFVIGLILGACTLWVGLQVLHSSKPGNFKRFLSSAVGKTEGLDMSSSDDSFTKVVSDETRFTVRVFYAFNGTIIHFMKHDNSKSNIQYTPPEVTVYIMQENEKLSDVIARFILLNKE